MWKGEFFKGGITGDVHLKLRSTSCGTRIQRGAVRLPRTTEGETRKTMGCTDVWLAASRHCLNAEKGISKKKKNQKPLETNGVAPEGAKKGGKGCVPVLQAKWQVPKPRGEKGPLVKKQNKDRAKPANARRGKGTEESKTMRPDCTSATTEKPTRSIQLRSSHETIYRQKLENDLGGHDEQKKEKVSNSWYQTRSPGMTGGALPNCVKNRDSA